MEQEKVLEAEVVTNQAVVKSEGMNTEALIQLAIEKGTAVDTMERLLAMRTQLKQEHAREEFFKALARFQRETPAIAKTKPVISKGTVKYHYAPLETIVEQVKNKLDENGFSYTLKTKQESDTITVTCEAHHVAGHTEPTSVTVPVGSDYMSKQQQVGAALTFAKRYAFCDAFGIMTGDEDVDGADMSDKEDKPTEKAREQTIQEKLYWHMDKACEGLPKDGKLSMYHGLLMEAGIEHKKAIRDLTVDEAQAVYNIATRTTK